MEQWLMPPTMTRGQVSTGGGTRHSQGRAKDMPIPNTPPALLAQTSPSVAPRPRFRPPQITQPQPYQAPNQSPQWRGGDNTNDGLIFRDRGPQMSRGTEYAGRISSNPDPPMDGPIRPSMRLVNRTWNWQVGTGSAYADDLTRPYTWVGEQGAGWTTIYGGTPGFYRRGPGGAPVGDPTQGPGRVWGGPPHGYHTMYPPAGQQTQATFRARPQMVPARVDRLSNSRIAGQSYSQTTIHQGATRR
jgi:hypothetical protein